MVPRQSAWIAAFAALMPLAASAAPEPVRTCLERHATALGRIACELGRGLPKTDAPVLVVPLAVETQLGAERLDEMSQRLGSLLAGELGAQARAASGPAVWQEVARQATPGRRVILIRPRLEAEQLSAVADELSAVPRFWERLRKVAPGSRAHVFAAHPLDAELRGFLPKVPLVVSRIDKSAPLDEPALAVACGDVDANGASEIVSVGRQRLQVGRIERGRFVVTRALAWNALAEVAPRPLREPLATAVVRTPGSLEVGLSDREAAIGFDSTLNAVARYPGRIPWPGGGCARFEATGLNGAPEPCALASTRTASAAAETIDAIAGQVGSTRDGKPQTVFARRRQRDSVIEVGDGMTWSPLAEPAGAQVAVSDLDGDGRPELVSTADTLDPTLDFVSVRTLTDAGVAAEAFRVPVPSGVHALTVCPPTASGIAPIVLATGEGLWVLR